MMRRNDNLSNRSSRSLKLPPVWLPTVPNLEGDRLEYAMTQEFKPTVLAWALHNGYPADQIERYITFYPTHQIQASLNDSKDTTFAVPFYAVHANCAQSLRLLMELDIDPNVTFPGQTRWGTVPLLGYAIMIGPEIEEDTTNVVSTLLAFGANPEAIPRDMWINYLKQPKADGVELDSTNFDDSWCSPELRHRVSKGFNLSQRYYVWKAATMGRRSAREKQYAKHHNLTNLFQLPYSIIGQGYATSKIVDEINVQYTIGHDSPLAMVFAGPSGHGKTEVARSLGDCLSLPLEIVDCTEMSQEWDIFGPKAPYFGSDVGSRVNNFLCHNDGKPSIVFLDEFEKTNQDVWNALLLVFDSGLYYDRRQTSKKIDCSKTIWVMASNIVDDQVVDFFNNHLKDATKSASFTPYSSLDRTMRTTMCERFGKPLVGRITTIIPFVPFVEGEAAVVAHKFIQSSAARARRNFDMEDLRLGRVDLTIRDDGAVCQMLAAQGYEVGTGARSLDRIVRDEVAKPLTRGFLKEEREVEGKMNDEPRQGWVVAVGRTVDGGEEVKLGKVETGR